MTIFAEPTTLLRTRVRADRASTPESEALTRLRAMLRDDAERDNWPEIRQAIDYLIGDTFVSDLAA